MTAPQIDTAAAQQALWEVAAEACAGEFGSSLQAVILTGSLARGEGTLVEDSEGCRLLGDAEFLLILRAGSRLPREQAVNRVARRIAQQLLERGVRGRVDLSAAHPSYLRKLRPHIFAFELRACGRVVWGDPGVLSLIPAFSPAAIPLEDGWRLLANRVVEQLELARELPDRSAGLSEELHYRTVKLYLDMATSLLLFAGAYAPTYRARSQRLKNLAAAQPQDGWAFPLTEFCETVTACTQFKVGATRRMPEPAWRLWERGADYARRLWHWELARMVGVTIETAPQELWGRWLRRQPLALRLAGWLRVMRVLGPPGAWQEFRRMVRGGCKTSPRYAVYGAAGELFFSLPQLLCLPSLRGEWRELRNALPGCPPRNETPGWRALALEIAGAYRQFLLRTRL